MLENHENQILTLPKEDLGYLLLLVITINNSLQSSHITRNRELNRLYQTVIELELEVFVVFVGQNHRANPISTQTKLPNFHSPFFVPHLQCTSTDKPPFDYQWGSIIFTMHLWFQIGN